MADPNAHQLYKQIGVGLVTNGTPISPGEDTTDVATGTGWVTLTDPIGSYHHLVNRTYIDLAGWSKQSLTMFTQGVDIQKSLLPLTSGTVPNVFIMDYLTTRKITDAELTSIATTASLPGFAANTLDLMEMIYGERMILGQNQQVLGTYIQISGETFGSGNPTAMDKLHWTRHIVVGAAAAESTLQIFPTNLVVQAMTLEEKDLVWIERLRRSYVLQDEADI
jgi:hypothetical protein